MTDDSRPIKLVELVMLSLIFAILMGIVTATFTQRLTINGHAGMNSSNWKIRFKNLRQVSLSGTAKELQKPYVVNNSTAIGEYSVSLTSPGDKAVYTFDVANEGTYPAKIGSSPILNPICEGKGENSTNDALNVCSHLSYKLYNSNGEEVMINDTLDAGEVKTMRLVLSYSEDVNQDLLPKNNVSIGNLSFSIVYVQDGLSK